MNKRSANIIATVCFTVIMILAIGSYHDVVITNDGIGYINIAKQILAGDFFKIDNSIAFADNPSSIRTPIYPMFIALADLLIGPIPGSIVTMQWLVASLVFLLVCLANKNDIPLAYTLIALSVCVLINYQLAFIVLSEWLGFCLCLLVFTFVHYLYKYKKAATFYVLAFTMACLALLKPVFVPAGLVVLCACCFIRISKKVRVLAVLIYLLPLLTWSIFNFQRQGVFGISPYGQFSLFGAAALCGSADSMAGDSPLLVSFINFANKNKFPARGTEKVWLDNILTNYRMEKYDHNLWLVADKFRIDNSLPRVEINKLAGIYAVRTIFNYPLNYLKYILAGVYFGALGYLAVFLTILFALMLKDEARYNASIRFAAVILASIHLVTITVSIFTITWLPRYEWMTGTPVLFALIIIIFLHIERLDRFKA